MNEQQNPESNALVTLIKGQPFTTTLIIAEGVGNQHKNIIAMVRQYQADLERFGLVAFETRPRLEGQHGGGDVEFAHLNERQATLLLSYMRNTEVVRRFKMAMVDAFFAMAEELERLRSEPRYLPGVAVAIGDFDENDRPVVVATQFGPAFFNTATYVMHMIARSNPHSEAHRQLTSAMAARREFAQALPEPFRTAHKLKMALLKANPLWSDILHCLRTGWTKATTARICGCHPSTLKRHIKKMKEAGLFDDPLSGMDIHELELFPVGALEGR